MRKDSMSIQELLEAARSTPVTPEEINELRTRLQQQERGGAKYTISKEFLERTYNI